MTNLYNRFLERTRMRKHKAILLTLCASLVYSASADGIFGWFGKSAGDDGKANTIGNPAAKLQKTVFYVNNQLVNNISRVSVTDAKGKSIYNSNFSCTAGSSCTLNLTNVALSTSLTFKFMNSKNELVGAYLISHAAAVNSATLDESWLGIYIFSQLVKASKKNPLDLNYQLVKSFNGAQSPDNTPDIYEELGLYFLAQNGGANESRFYSTLLQKLNNNQKLVAAPKKTKRLKSTGGYTKATNLSSSQAPAVGSAVPEQKSICDSTVQSSLEYVQNLAGFIPVVGDAFAAVLGIGEQTLNDSCPKSMDEDVANKFREIDQHLVRIDAELNNLGYEIGTLQVMMAETEAKGVLSDMNDNARKLNSLYLDKYTQLIQNSNLDTYVKQNGNLKKAFNDTQVSNLLANITDQMTSFEDLINNAKLQQMKIVLDNVCNGTNISGDLINTRTRCNMAISRVVFTYGLNAVKMKAMLNDEITVIANAIKSGNVNNAWLRGHISENFNFNGQTASWDKASDLANKIIDEKIKFITDTLMGADGSKLYKPLDGLSPTLQQNIIAAKCSYQLNTSSPVIAAIKEWHTIAKNESNASPYIITECDDGTSTDGVNNTKITSKYYYNQRDTTNVDDKVVNAMGVLVPDRFFHGGSQNNYGYNPAFPWANSSKITSDANSNSYYSDHTFKGTFNIPSNGTTGNAKSYVIGFEPAKINQSLLKAGENNTSITAFKEESKDKFVTTYRFDTDKSELFTILRYTKGNYAYAWVMRTWGWYSEGGSFSDYKYNLMGTPQCITNDCSINNTGNKLEQVKFIDGTTIDWTKNNSLDADGYDPTVYPATTYSEYTINVK